jgi:hypothetical protein
MPTMRLRHFATACATCATCAIVLLPAIVTAQSSASPVAAAFKDNEQQMAKNLIAAAEAMPADKYGFKPTPAQMSYGDIMLHLIQGNDFLCAAIGGAKAPARGKMAATAPKDSLVARLRETFKFCDEATAKLDDSKITEQLPMFGGKTMSRVGVEMVTVGDWADHYSQVAIYLRLNGQLPPTAKKP